MIFYFTGTGNSLYIAKKLSKAINDEELIDMAKAVNSGEMKFTVGESENVGFVFPTYFGTLPVTVRKFISRVSLADVWGKYVWAAVTCGSEMTTVPKFFSSALEERRISVGAVFEIKMPDNYVIMYNPTSPDAAAKILKNADESLPYIIDKIRNRSVKAIRIGAPEKFMGTVLSHMYDKVRNTEKFSVNDRCTSCLLCEKICPEKAIEIKNGKPVWVKDKCAHCVGCISRCPAFAIEYGKATEKRRRYINPIL